MNKYKGNISLLVIILCSTISLMGLLVLHQIRSFQQSYLIQKQYLQSMVYTRSAMKIPNKKMKETFKKSFTEIYRNWQQEMNQIETYEHFLTYDANQQAKLKQQWLKRLAQWIQMKYMPYQVTGEMLENLEVDQITIQLQEMSLQTDKKGILVSWSLTHIDENSQSFQVHSIVEIDFPKEEQINWQEVFNETSVVNTDQLAEDLWGQILTYE